MPMLAPAPLSPITATTQITQPTQADEEPFLFSDTVEKLGMMQSQLIGMMQDTTMQSNLISEL